MKNEEAKNLLTSEENYLEKLRKIVEESIEQEKLIINNLLNPPAEILTCG